MDVTPTTPQERQVPSTAGALWSRTSRHFALALATGAANALVSAVLRLLHSLMS